MKKCRAALLLVLAAVMSCRTTPEAPALRVSDSVYYLESYDDCRRAFLERAGDVAARYRGVEMKRLSVPSAIDDDLSIDLLYLPAQERAERLFLLTSGLHGTEGFAGSAVQRMFLTEILPSLDLRQLGILIVHAVNPYGFKYLRRVSENNVDLNRNFDSTDALFDIVNDGYTEVSELLNPAEPVDLSSWGNRLFVAQAVYNIATKGMAPLRQAIVGGQYQVPHGLYFGGQRFEPHRSLLRPILQEAMSAYYSVFTVDLHTGYGERGRLHLFPNPIEDPVVRGRLESLFEGHHIDWGDSDDFYTVTGDFVQYIGSLAGPEHEYLPMVFEFGTLDSQTTAGSIETIHRAILENQGHHHGYASEDDRREVRRLTREQYYPSDPRWRARVMTQARERLREALGRYQPEVARER